MKSLNTLTHAKGFTLIEIIVVIAVFTIVLGLGLFMTMDSYKGYSFRSERDVVVSVLGQARSRAVNNMYQTRWGVCYDNVGKNYVLFRGSTYTAGAATNEPIPANQAVTLSGFPLCSSASWVVFEQLTGALVPALVPHTQELAITITQDTRSSVVSINNEGRINW